jgi:hypothetical protein
VDIGAGSEPGVDQRGNGLDEVLTVVDHQQGTPIGSRRPPRPRSACR